MAGSRAEALRLSRPGLERKYRAYVQWGQNAPMPEGDSLDLAIDELIKERFLIGSSADVTEDIVGLVRATGINHLVISTHWPGMEPQVAMDSMQRFAEEVMPAVRQSL